MLRARNILAALLAVALIWSYLATHRKESARGGGAQSVAVWSTPPREIAKLTYRSGESEITLTPQWTEHADEPYVWVQAREPKARPAAKPGSKFGKKPEPAREDSAGSKGSAGDKHGAGGDIEEVAFKGNAHATRMIQSFSELNAKRDLGLAAGLNLSELGLSETSTGTFIEMSFRGGRASWRAILGRKAYGGANRYVRSLKNDHVYLVQSRTLDGLTNAGRRMLDSQLIPFPPAKAERIVIEYAGAVQTLWRVPGKKARQVYWADTKDGADTSEAMGRVVAALARIRVDSYLPPDTPINLLAEVTIRYFKESAGQSPLSVKIYPGDDKTMRAVSSHTVTPVRVKTTPIRTFLQLVRKLPSQ